MHTYIEGEMKCIWLKFNTWGIWVQDIQEFLSILANFLKLFQNKNYKENNQASEIKTSPTLKFSSTYLHNFNTSIYLIVIVEMIYDSLQ